MAIEDFYKISGGIYYKTASVLDGTAPGPTIAPTRQPAGPAHISIRLTNSAAGSVEVFGEVAGSPDSETVDLSSGDDARETQKEFTSIDRFETAIASGEISAEALAGSGEPVIAEVLGGTVMMRVKAQRGDIRMAAAGDQEIADYVGASMADSLLVAGRFVQADLGDGRLKKFRIIYVTPLAELGNVNFDLKFLKSAGP